MNADTPEAVVTDISQTEADRHAGEKSPELTDASDETEDVTLPAHDDPVIEPDALPAEERRRIAAQKNAASAAHAVEQVLAQHDCHIVTILTQRRVGEGPTADLMIGSTYGIMPNANG